MPNAPPDRPIVVSTRTLLTAVILVVAAMLVYVLKGVLVTVFVAMVMSAAMDPSITRLERRGVPRPVGLAIIFFGIVALVVVLLVVFVPLVVDQAQQLAAHLPEIYQRNLDQLRRNGYGHIALAVQNGVASLAASSGTAARTAFGSALNFVRALLSVFGALVLTFYMAMQQQQLKFNALELSPPRHRPRIARLLRTTKVRLGQWLRGQLLLGLVIGVVSYGGLLVLQVKFALVLALLAGVTELIPVVGPIIGAIPAVIVALADEPVKGLWVALTYIAIQQLENHLLVPRIMANATGLNPITVIVAILIGAKLAGIVGVFVAVPASIIVQVLVEDWMSGRKLLEAQPLSAAATAQTREPTERTGS